MENLTNFAEEIQKPLHASTNYDEWATKLLEILRTLTPNRQICGMIMEGFVTSQFHRDYFGLFAAHLCQISNDYRTIFQEIFQNFYEVNSAGEPNLHRIYEEAKFFAFLLRMDSIFWTILSCLKLNEDTTFTQEYFITLLLLELSNNLGKEELCKRLKDPSLQNEFQGLFPKDKLENIHYAIKIFELVDLQPLTLDLYKYMNLFQNEELTLGVHLMSL